MDDSAVNVVVVGSVAMDTVATPFEHHADVLGGSCSYACAAASFFSRPGMVGVAGSDFPEGYRALYDRFNIDTAGLQMADGKTFRWSGVYDGDMINRTTLVTELNVFEQFRPELPESYRDAPYLLLGNIAPELQLHVLDACRNPHFIMADTMDLWIKTQREKVLEVLGRVTMLMLNDMEARLLAETYHLRDCAEWLLEHGPRYVVIKKGEHGAVLFSRDELFIVPAYPVRKVVDPTGAGDAFAGGFLGALAGDSGREDAAALRRALLYGSVAASRNVEAFGLDALEQYNRADMDRRIDELLKMIRIEI